MIIGILISGRGSNMVAIVDAVKGGEIPDSNVAVVISDKSAAAGIAKAQERGIEAIVIERRGRSREEHDADIIAELNKTECRTRLLPSANTETPRFYACSSHKYAPSGSLALMPPFFVLQP